MSRKRRRQRRVRTLLLDQVTEPPKVRLMAEYGGAYLWVTGGAISGEQLGLSADLIRRLEQWNNEWEIAAPRDPSTLRGEELAQSRAEGRAWFVRGRDLAFEIQHELTTLGKNTDVYYVDDDDPRPMSSR